MSFKAYSNPWSANNSPWFNEEKNQWADGGEFNKWLSEVPEDEKTEEKTKGGFAYSYDGKYYGKLTNTGFSDEIYLVDENDVTISKTGKYSFKKLTLFKWKSGSKVLKKDFDYIVATLYAESSGGYEETLAIYNVCENRANQDKVSILKAISESQPYGVYGSRPGDRKRYTDEKGPNADTKRKNCHKAFIDGVHSINDASKGAFFWDGIDFSIKGSRANDARYLTGYKFTNASHDLWDQGDNLLVDEDGNPTGFQDKMHGKYSYKYESVTAIGATLFSKLSDEYGDLLFRAADGKTIRKSNWNGQRAIT